MPYQKPKGRTRGLTNATFAPVKIDLEDFKEAGKRIDELRERCRKLLEEIALDAPKAKR